MQITVELDDDEAIALMTAMSQVRRLFIETPPPAAPIIAGMRAVWTAGLGDVLVKAAVAFTRAVDMEQG